MKIIERNIIRWLCLAVFPLTGMASCGSDAPDRDHGGIQIGQTVSMRIAVGSDMDTRSGIPVTDDGIPETDTEEAGSASENAIDISDIENGDYRILFFDSDNKFISRFKPAFAAIDPTVSGGRVYNIIGSLSSKLPENFKVVVLANWGNYPDLIKGETTIEKVCSETYDYIKYGLEFKPFDGENGGIPMYGIKTCTDVSMTPDQLYPLGTIDMLRAMAKVEIICDDENIKIEEATLNCVNSKGYFAPSEMDSITDNNVKSVRIPVDAKVMTDTVYGEANKVVFYIPEYDNTDGNAFVKLKFRFPELGEEEESGTGNGIGNVSGTASEGGGNSSTYEREGSIYFKNYGEDEVVDKPFDIVRNYVYRFRVRFKTTIEVDYTICPWKKYTVDIPSFD